MTDALTAFERLRLHVECGLDLPDAADLMAEIEETAIRTNAAIAAAYERAAEAATTFHVQSDDDYSVGWTDGRRSAGHKIKGLTPADAQQALDTLIAKAVAEERARCAKVAEKAAIFDQPDELRAGDWWSGVETAQRIIAKAIREGE